MFSRQITHCLTLTGGFVVVVVFIFFADFYSKCNYKIVISGLFCFSFIFMKSIIKCVPEMVSLIFIDCPDVSFDWILTQTKNPPIVTCIFIRSKLSL